MRDGKNRIGPTDGLRYLRKRRIGRVKGKAGGWLLNVGHKRQLAVILRVCDWRRGLTGDFF